MHIVADSQLIILSATVKELLKSDICESYAQMKKGSSFFLTRSVESWCAIADGEKSLMIYAAFQQLPACDRQTDG